MSLWVIRGLRIIVITAIYVRVCSSREARNVFSGEKRRTIIVKDEV